MMNSNTWNHLIEVETAAVIKYADCISAGE